MRSAHTIPRVWWLSAALLVAAGATYVSLVPFTFVSPPHALTAAYVWQRMLDPRGLSHTNVIANAIMTLPFGFFATASMTGDTPRPWQWALVGLVVLVISVALSVTIETLQVFVPGRTPSLADIEAQTVGTAAGVGVWFLVGHEVRMLASRLVSGSRRALETVLAAYAAVQFLLLAEPFDVTVEPSDLAVKFRRGGIVINPLLSPAFKWEALPSLIADVVLAVPVGFLAGVALTSKESRRSVPAAIALGVAFYAAGEFVQVLVRSRSADVVDFLANAAGVVVGALLAAVARRPHASPKANGGGRAAWMTAALIGAAILYAAYNWSPFDFVFSSRQMEHRAGMLARVPFFAYYVNPEFKALRDACLKLSLALPLGVLFQLRWPPERTSAPRVLTAGWLVLTGLFFTVVEIGQIFLPSRYPDNSDILTGVIAVWLGIVATRPFTRGAVRHD